MDLGEDREKAVASGGLRHRSEAALERKKEGNETGKKIYFFWFEKGLMV